MYLPTAARAATDTGADSTEPNAALFFGVCIDGTCCAKWRTKISVLQPQLSANRCCIYMWCLDVKHN